MKSGFGSGSRGGLSWLAGLILLALSASSCSRKAAEAGRRPGPGGAGPPVPVLAAVAEARDMPVNLGAIGTVEAYSTVAIRPQLTGKIEAVHFQEGQEVAAGDLLLSLDARPWEAALNQARANLARDEAQLTSARLGFERTRNLFDGKIASQQDYDSAEAAYQALVATVLADQAAVTNAQLDLEYTKIRSPIDGRTGSLSVKAGNVVKATDDILLTIAQIHPVYVAFSVPEQHLTAVRRRFSSAKLPVAAVVPGQAQDAACGELTFVNNTVDTNTGTILLKATFENTNNILWPGQFVQVSLTLSNLVQAIVVPSQAVQTGQEGEFVFIVQPDGTVAARPVATGVVQDNHTVIEQGVRPGETIVTDGQLRLVPGAKVTIKPGLHSGTSSRSNAGERMN